MCLLVVTFVIFTFTARSTIAEWDLDETKLGGPFKEILDYDILVNCILLMEVQYTLLDDYWSLLLNYRFVMGNSYIECVTIR